MDVLERNSRCKVKELFTGLEGKSDVTLGPYPQHLAIESTQDLINHLGDMKYYNHFDLINVTEDQYKLVFFMIRKNSS